MQSKQFHVGLRAHTYTMPFLWSPFVLQNLHIYVTLHKTILCPVSTFFYLRAGKDFYIKFSAELFSHQNPNLKHA